MTASRFSAPDRRLMARALRLAARGRVSAPPNPAVGCVLAHGDEIVAEGWHERAGGPHAEIVALQRAGARAHGATAYVTLEPCAHHGRTGPCTEALADAGVGRVVFAVEDPNPQVRGEGARALRAAGIAVDSGLLAAEAAALNAGFMQRMRDGRPRVTAKIAASLDGGTAMASGESQWITGTAARDDVQTLRAESGAVLTGIGTVLADDPSLTVRAARFGAAPRQPLRVIVDSTARCPSRARLLGAPGATLMVGLLPENRIAAAATERVDYWRAPDDGHGRVSLAALLEELARREINDVLVEAGATLVGAMARDGLIDRWCLYLAPRLLGSATRPLLDVPGWQKLTDGVSLQLTDVRQVGADLRITASTNRE